MKGSNIKSAEAFNSERLRIRECRQDLVKFLDQYGFHLFITLATNRPGSEAFARDKFKGFMARFDRNNAGRSWHKNLNMRSVAVASLEHMDSNLHLHIVLQIPELVMSQHPIKKGKFKKRWRRLAKYWEPTIKQIWGELCPQGSADILPYLKGASAYSMKGAGNRISYENFMLSTEFHPVPRPVKETRDANSQKARNDVVRTRLLRREKHIGKSD